jgi:hypothetical protein
MIQCQKNQIAIQDKLLKEKDNLLKEKDVFVGLQYLEIAFLRDTSKPIVASAALESHGINPPTVPAKPLNLKSKIILDNSKIDLMEQIRRGIPLKNVKTTKRKATSIEQELSDGIKKIRSRVESSSSISSWDT